MLILLLLAGLTLDALIFPFSFAFAETLRFRLVPERSEIMTEIIDPFGQRIIAGINLREGEARGEPRELKATGWVRLTIDVASYRSNLAVRDQDVLENYLEVGTYPTITFTSQVIEEATPPRAAKDPWQVRLRGVLEFHGVKKEIRVPLLVSHEGDRITAEGHARIVLKDFNVAVPTFLFLLKSSDSVEVKFRIVGERQT